MKFKIGQELKNSKGVSFQNGMQLTNANGDVDTTSLGYQYTIQTTTQIRAHIVTQKFYEVPPADFIPVVPGTGAWMENIKTNLVYDVAGDFSTGIIATASAPTQLAQVDVGTAPLTQVITTWAKGYTYSVPEVQKALASNNWDVVSAKMEALKRNWDLGIQKIAFLGLLGDTTNTPGLLTNSAVTVDTGTITKMISLMSAAEFATLVAKILGVYFANSNSTALPNTFIIPMDDYLGLAVPVSSQFPNISMLAYLEQAFKAITGNPSFKVHGLAYGSTANNKNFINSATGKNRYVLYRKDVDVMAMDIPVEFFLTPAGTQNNFNFQGVGCGQFTGCNIFRPAEVIYFDHT